MRREESPRLCEMRDVRRDGLIEALLIAFTPPRGLPYLRVYPRYSSTFLGRIRAVAVSGKRRFAPLSSPPWSSPSSSFSISSSSSCFSCRFDRSLPSSLLIVDPYHHASHLHLMYSIVRVSLREDSLLLSLSLSLFHFSYIHASHIYAHTYMRRQISTGRTRVFSLSLSPSRSVPLPLPLPFATLKDRTSSLAEVNRRAIIHVNALIGWVRNLEETRDTRDQEREREKERRKEREKSTKDKQEMTKRRRGGGRTEEREGVTRVSRG